MTTFIGSAIDEAIQGDTTNDSLSGAGGNDTIEGMGGNDTLDGGTGTDLLTFTNASAAVNINLTVTTAQSALGGSVTISGFENLEGTDFNDTLVGDGNANTILGGLGNDKIDAGAGNDSVDAGIGNDTVIGGDGADTLNGGIGIDLVDYSTETGGAGVIVNLSNVSISNGTVTVAAGKALDTFGNTDSLIQMDSVTGTAQGDLIAGNATSNKIDGGAGNDTIEGVGGLDTLIGGAGNDTLSYQLATGGVTINLAVATVQNTIGAGSEIISGFENLNGSNFNDNLTGDANVNTLLGNAGNDLLNGAAGNDSIDGGAGNDTILGSVGNDTIAGGTNTTGANTGDTISYVNGTAVTVDLSAGTATSAANTVVGTVTYLSWGSDSFTGIENAIGSVFSDSLTGDSGANKLEGMTGADTLVGGNGADTIDGGLGAALDLLNYSAEAGGGAVIVNMLMTGSVTNGTVTVAAGTAIDTYGATDKLINVESVNGTTGADWLIGSFMSNKLDGGTGNDTIEGAGGVDTLIGGVGTDTVSFEHAILGVTFNLANTTTIQNTVGGGLALATGFENLTGSNNADTLRGDANANLISGLNGDDTMFGGLGNDTLNGGGGSNTASFAGTTSAETVNLTAGTAVGGAGSDTLISVQNVIGTSFADSITGDANNNVIEGGAGADTLTGGGGNDTVSYSTATLGVRVDLTVSTAQSTVGAGADVLSGFSNIIGSYFGDRLVGNANDNIIEGGAGNDTMYGGGGNDTISYEHAGLGVKVNLNLLTQNTVGAGTDTISGFVNILGGKGNDSLTGTSAGNVIAGGTGNDTLTGGLGSDTLTGGSGADAFYFASVMEGGDHITDFASIVDNLRISATGFGGGLVANTAAVLQTGVFATGAAPAFVYDAGSGNLWFDIDGGGATAATLLVTLDNKPATLNVADIKLV